MRTIDQLEDFWYRFSQTDLQQSTQTQTLLIFPCVWHGRNAGPSPGNSGTPRTPGHRLPQDPMDPRDPQDL